MADNITLNAGSGGSDIATDQDAGLAHHQYVKVEWGPDNTQTKVDIGASALPIQDGGNSITVDGTVAVSGTVTVNGSGSTQPISATSLPLPTGAATAAKQPALGTAGTASADVITVQGIASMTALKVDGSAVTQPVSAASLPLPSGASTAAKQPALGTAGTASADVITVQGIASMTPLLVNASGNAVPVTDNAGSLTVDNNGTFATQAAQSGVWNITNVSGTVSLPTGAATAAKQPALGTAGAASADVITVQGIASMTALKVDGSAVTQPVSIAATVNTSDVGRSAVIHFQASIPTTVGGTQLASNACKEATVKNLLSNSNIIWVGITGVAANSGYELNPGEALTLKVSNTNLIYCLSASGSQTVCVIATN